MFIFSSGNQGDNITDWYGELLSRSIPRANTITDCMLYKRVWLCTKGVVDLQTGGNKMLDKTTTKKGGSHMYKEKRWTMKTRGDDLLCCVK